MNTNAEHQLRTPLNHIIGYCELLLEEAADRGREQFEPDLRRIHGAGKRLLAVIGDLFDPDKGEELGSTRSGHDDMRALLREIIGHVEILQEEAAAAGVADVMTDLGHIAVAARELLHLTVEHLLGPEPTRLVAARDAITFVRRPASPQFEAAAVTGSLLVVDDDPRNRDMLSRRLVRLGHRVTAAASGGEAIEALRRDSFDVMLLDMQMPDMDGDEVLELVRGDPVLRSVPVIVLSASDDAGRVARCIESGAEDYLPKPFDPVLLQARLTACLERKWLRDREQLHVRQIRAEQQKSEALLLNILPAAVADRLKRGEREIADSFPEASVLFADLVGFSSFAAGLPPAHVVERLNTTFSAFDQAVGDLGLEKVKTIGDCYMAVGGVPVPQADHVEAIADLALRMLREIAQVNAGVGPAIQVRIGVHFGPVVAGIIGRHKYAYDVWGDAVNVASRMESLSLPGRIQVTAVVEERLRGRFQFEPRGPVELKGVGSMSTFFLLARA